MTASSSQTAPRPPRLSIDASLAGREAPSLVEDVRRGLLGPHKWLPSKYFYDAVGSRLFDAICNTPEYYATRVEGALLAELARPLAAELRATHLVELGSGAARKTRVLLEAMHRVVGPVVYVPLDVSEEMLRDSARALLADYPWLTVEGVVGDFARTLGRVPAGERRLFAFLGGTIGNFDERAAPAFLSRIRAAMHPGDLLLLGADLVKDSALLNAAYNDADGITEAFNKNLLVVLNRELGANFDPCAFEHLAFYDEDRCRVEMHLRSLREQNVVIGALDATVHFAEGETLHTEISRKFTKASLTQLLAEADLELRRFVTPANGWFGLALAAPA